MLKEARQLNMDLLREMTDWKVKDARNRHHIERIEDEVKDAEVKIIELLQELYMQHRGEEADKYKQELKAATLKSLVETLANEIRRIREISRETPNYDFEKAEWESKMQEMRQKMKSMESLMDELKRENSRLKREYEKMKRENERLKSKNRRQSSHAPHA